MASAWWCSPGLKPDQRVVTEGATLLNQIR